MSQDDLLELAKRYFIFDAGLSKANLIRKIQVEQGHIDCYATGKSSCEQMQCWWRKGCLSAAAEDLPADVHPNAMNRGDHEDQ